MSTADTIFALSSGRPPAAIAVVRISGAKAGDALARLMGRMPEPRKAALARVRDPASGEPIDEALALWFPGPHSETGEDVAELQLHGGRAVVAAVLAALGRIDGLRPAEAGEFTRRAFENGKLDLTAVEGLADLIYAETEAQRRQAYRHLKGLLGERAETWRARLIEALALVEARIDFPDEGDVPEDLLGPALKIAAALRDEIADALAGAARGERLRDGLVVAIAGPPNVGKSTLLNRLARREAAIVSPIPGTTRDVIEVHLDLGGYPVTILDTAGVRTSNDPIEQEGVRRALVRAAESDLVLWVEDVRQPEHGLESSELGSESSEHRSEAAEHGSESSELGSESTELGSESTELGSEFAELGSESSEHGSDSAELGSEAAELGSEFAEKRRSAGRTAPRWRIRNKVDLLPALTKNNNRELDYSVYENTVEVSALNGDGTSELLAALSRYVADHFGPESALITRERHRKALEIAASALNRALFEGKSGREDLVAEELRIAATSLGRLTGRVDVEDVLDVIFRDFCIGK